jgi:hypothetical protein
MTCDICGGLGYTIDDSGEVPCVCKVKDLFERHLKVFKLYGAPSNKVKQMVDLLVNQHKTSLGVAPMHWWYVASPPMDAMQNKKFIMNFWFEYLIKTRTFYDFKLITLQDILGLYYSYGSGTEDASDTDFYGFKCKTILIVCEPGLLSKQMNEVLRHYIDIYKDKNIFVFMSKEFNDPLDTWLTSSSTGQYVKNKIPDIALAIMFKTQLPWFKQLILR